MNKIDFDTYTDDELIHEYNLITQDIADLYDKRKQIFDEQCKRAEGTIDGILQQDLRK